MKFLTRQQLMKVVLGMQKHIHTFGQVVCNEGSPSSNLVIIGRGEYQLSKRVEIQDKNNIPGVMSESQIKARVSHNENVS